MGSTTPSPAKTSETRETYTDRFYPVSTAYVEQIGLIETSHRIVR